MPPETAEMGGVVPYLNKLRDWSLRIRLGQLVAWCAPALLLGLFLRASLTSALPLAFLHDDTADFLSTPIKLMEKGELAFHEKKTFLSPVLFCAPFLLGLPSMKVVPWAQHLLGLMQVVLVGGLVRMWFTRWKAFIIPITLIMAANPYFIWFEHTLMAESHYVFTTLLLALAGSLYVKAPTRGHFIFLCVTLFLEAGARPEGKLLFGFGLLAVALVHFVEWQKTRAPWKPTCVRLGLLVLLGAATHFLTKTSQGGLLLYISVARLTPTELSIAPGFEPYIAPLRADLQERWDQRPNFPRVADRKELSRIVKVYMDDQMRARGHKKREGHEGYCMKLARATCLANLGYLPVHVYHKFRYTASDAPSDAFDDFMLYTKQREAFTDCTPMIMQWSPLLFGENLNSPAAVQNVLDTRYGVVPSFNALHTNWTNAVCAWRLPDRVYPNPEKPKAPFVYRGIPIYFLLGMLGGIVMMFRKGELRPFHIAWVLALGGLFFVIMLTGNVRPRFRLVFEPFWFLYIGLLLDGAVAAMATIVRAKSTDATTA